MDGFFVPVNQRKNKRKKPQTQENEERKKPKQDEDFEISSEEGDLDTFLNNDANPDVDSEDESEKETADEKRVRLAKEYISKVEGEAQLKRIEQGAYESSEDESDIDREAIAHRLKKDVLEHSGKLHRRIAHKLLGHEWNTSSFIRIRGHKLSPTAVAITGDSKYVFSCSKDGRIIKYNLELKKKVTTFAVPATNTARSKKPHLPQLLAIAISHDNTHLAVGGSDNKIYLFDVATCKLVNTLPGHKAPVTGLVFRRGIKHLYSCSEDRTVKLWNIEDMVYMETLFGHQSEVMGIDCLMKERAITASRDNTLRLWKIPEETQLVFRGKGALDCCSCLNEELFVSAGDHGAIQLWAATKKKPVVVRPDAHDPLPPARTDLALPPLPRWIATIKGLAYTDLFVTGSSDGQCRLWAGSAEKKAVDPVSSLDMPGFINGAAFSNDGWFLALAVGREHRLGRWDVMKDVSNAVIVVPLPPLIDAN